jgi:competence protein ComFC
MKTDGIERGLMKANQAFRFTLDSINHLFWPAMCNSCKSVCPAGENLCRDCWEQLLTCTAGHYCRRCGRDASQTAMLEGVCPDCQGREIHFDKIARAGVYDKTLRQMILSFKHGRTELDSILGFLVDSALQGSGFVKEIELFVPVPLHWSRRLIRGYNQSEVLLRRLKSKKAVISTDLVRVRLTKFQTSFDEYKAWEAKRAANVAGAFAVRDGHSFAGRKICLVDDIKTSGATLNECAKVLKQAGAAKVFALVLAVAGQKL